MAGLLSFSLHCKIIVNIVIVVIIVCCKQRFTVGTVKMANSQCTAQDICVVNGNTFLFQCVNVVTFLFSGFSHLILP